MHKTIKSHIRIILIGLCVLMMSVAPHANAAEKMPTLRLVHTDWSSSVASANLLKAVFQEKLGIHCQLKSVTADKMWQAVAEGRADAMLSAWLPDTHARYHEKFRDQVVDLGPNLKGTKIGFVVPDVTLGRLTAGTGIRNQPYINIDSIPELKTHADKFNHRIVGIEPEAGVMHKAREAMGAYGLDNFRLVESSEVSMVAELSHAIRHQKWLVVTGWLPHWSFARWSLKFLDDPKNVFGDQGHIHTVAREGLKQDMPQAFKVLDRFFWQPEDVGQLMLWIQEDDGRFPYEKALRWMRTHPDKIEEWIEQRN
ncbi:MAG TPA: glycine betaine ABC transporter substrate-binding protein [Desulfosalsimonadaceae bacterium]|nr:glycine betaine ABC transporter substrate-binding protein [Desulfosalsimonadaceae bacterium]